MILAILFNECIYHVISRGWRPTLIFSKIAFKCLNDSMISDELTMQDNLFSTTLEKITVGWVGVGLL